MRKVDGVNWFLTKADESRLIDAYHMLAGWQRSFEIAEEMDSWMEVTDAMDALEECGIPNVLVDHAVKDTIVRRFMPVIKKYDGQTLTPWRDESGDLL